MLKLTLTAIDSPVTVQDPRAITQNNGEQGVITAEPGAAPAEVTMQWGQIERIQQQLSDLAALGMCTFTIESADVAAFAEQPDAPINPTIDFVNGAVAAAGTTGVVSLTGNNLMAGQVMASAAVAGDADAGTTTIEVLNPGYEGNLYDVVVVDSGGAGPATLTDAVVDGRTVLTLDLVGVTVDNDGVKTLVDANYAGVLQATVTGVGGTNVSVQDLQAFEGGIGTGLAVSLCSVACTVTAIDVSADPIHVLSIDTPDVTTTPGAAALDPARILVRSNAKEDMATVVLA